MQRRRLVSNRRNGRSHRWQKGPVLLVLRPLLNPLLQDLLLSRGQGALRFRRRHDHLRIRGMNPSNHFTVVCLTGDDRRLTTVTRQQRRTAHVQSQTALPSSFIATMTAPAVIGQDRPHMLIKIQSRRDSLSHRLRNSLSHRGGCRDTTTADQQRQQDAGPQGQQTRLTTSTSTHHSIPPRSSAGRHLSRPHHEPPKSLRPLRHDTRPLHKPEAGEQRTQTDAGGEQNRRFCCEFSKISLH